MVRIHFDDWVKVGIGFRGWIDAKVGGWSACSLIRWLDNSLWSKTGKLASIVLGVVYRKNTCRVVLPFTTFMVPILRFYGRALLEETIMTWTHSKNEGTSMLKETGKSQLRNK